MNPIYEAAIQYLDAGLSVIPLRPKDKRPLLAWTEYQKRRPTEDEIANWFEEHPERNIGIVCGSISGDLVVVDVDGPEGLEWARGRVPLTTVYTKTPKNDATYHFFFRGKGIRNSKPHQQVDIRGEGGYVVAPPSIHPNGGQYLAEILYGSEGWAELAPFSINQPLGLDLSAVKTTPTIEPKTEGSRNQTLAQLVGKWCSKGNDIDDVYLLARAWNSGCMPPLPDAELVRTVDSIIKTHNRNHPAMIIEPAPDEEPPEAEVSTEADEEMPEELLQPGGILQQIMNYTDASNVVSVPVFAMAGAIALMGTVCGQKIMTVSKLRTNVYVVSLGYSGAGKNAACSSLPQILLHAARDAAGPSELASAQALLRWLATDKHHVSLLCLDELGMLIKGLRYPDSPKADIPRILTRLFSSTDRPDVKSFADAKLNFTIPYHCLCLYGASTPAEFWKGMSTDDATNGFLARLLVFESRNKAPRPKEGTIATVPKSLIQSIADLWNIAPPIDPTRGNISAVPIPYVIEMGADSEFIWRPWCNKWHDIRNDCLDDAIKSPIYGRIVEQAWKLALIHAASSQGAEIINSKTIHPDSVEWATKLAEWQANRLVKSAADCICDNDWHAQQKKIVDIIRRKAREERPGVTAREMSKDLHLPTRLFDDLLQSLEQSGKIHRRTVKNTRGRDSILFCITKEGKK